MEYDDSRLTHMHTSEVITLARWALSFPPLWALTQLAECSTVNRNVPGSSPGCPAMRVTSQIVDYRLYEGGVGSLPESRIGIPKPLVTKYGSQWC